jgi:hypothetical protein
LNQQEHAIIWFKTPEVRVNQDLANVSFDVSIFSGNNLKKQVEVIPAINFQLFKDIKRPKVF